MKQYIYNNRLSIILMFLAVLMLSSCAMKKLKKQAVQYHSAGMYEMAVNNYLTVLNKKPADAEAKIGLMKSAALYANKLEDDIDKYYLQASDSKVVEYYNILKNLVGKVDYYQVPLEISERAIGEYEESKNRYIENNHARALDLIKHKNYDAAYVVLEEVARENHNYKNTTELMHLTKCEPIYNKVVSMMKSADYKNAYYQAQQLINIDPGYKDISDLQVEALVSSKKVVLVDYSVASSRYSTFLSNMKRYATTYMESYESQFFSVMEVGQYNDVLSQWKARLRNSESLNTTGIVPAKYLLRAKVDNVSVAVGKLTKEKKKGFIRTVYSKDSVVYTKIYYYEYKQKKSVSSRISYTLVDRMSNRVLQSNSIDNVAVDELHYIYYNGKVDTSILPGYWKNKLVPFRKGEDEVSDGFLVRARMSNLARGKRVLESTATMEQDLSQRAAQSLSKIMKVVQ